MVRHCGFWYRGLGPTRVVDGAAMDTRGSCVSFSVNRGSGHLSLQFNKEITQGQARLIGQDNTSTSKSVALVGEFPTRLFRLRPDAHGCVVSIPKRVEESTWYSKQPRKQTRHRKYFFVHTTNHARCYDTMTQRRRGGLTQNPFKDSKIRRFEDSKIRRIEESKIRRIEESKNRRIEDSKNRRLEELKNRRAED